MRLSVRRKVDLPDPVGPISAVIDPRRMDVHVGQHGPPGEAERELERLHDVLWARRVRIERHQGLVDAELLGGRNGFFTKIG